ncbi:MAG: hypothetical protein F4147_09480 [Gammaproteobacteria bacterium]|nr:hypothetical protein [Gammaproteobacteria bacterium]
MTGVNEQDERLPEALVDELKRIDRAPEVITSRVDRSLAGMAHAQFAQRRVPRWQPQGAWRVAAAACVLVVVLFTTNHLWEQDDTSLYADIDGSGQIDIADVLALARAEDGVDQADIDAFAYRLVALDRDGML